MGDGDGHGLAVEGGGPAGEVKGAVEKCGGGGRFNCVAVAGGARGREAYFRTGRVVALDRLAGEELVAIGGSVGQGVDPLGQVFADGGGADEGRWNLEAREVGEGGGRRRRLARGGGEGETGGDE